MIDSAKARAADAAGRYLDDNLLKVISDPEMGGGEYEYERILAGADEHGRGSYTSVRRVFNGNVQPAPGRERELLPEGDQDRAAILVYTPEALSAGDGQSRADRIYHAGAVYRVRLVEPWREHAGFTKAIAVLEKEPADDSE
jgi:hypothetical protein